MREVHELNQREYQQLVLDMIVTLHKKGYGLLKLLCYTKEGLGAWRHMVFAADTFPDGRIRANIPEPKVFCSFRDMPLARHIDPETSGILFLASNSELGQRAIGNDSRYTSWFSSIAMIQANGVFEMERPHLATLGGIRIYTPYMPENNDYE